MAGAQEPPGGRLTDHISLGVLSAAFSRDLIEEVIGAAGKYIARHNNYRVKKPGETASTRHDGPATIQIHHANPRAA